MCGIIGVENTSQAAALVGAGLITLQHRGEESAGVTFSGVENMRTLRCMGLASNIFNDDMLTKKCARASIGHVRYTTSSKSSLINAQPFQMSCIHGRIAVAHNGNITNFLQLKETLEKRGDIFTHTSDTEILLHLMAMSKSGTLSKIVGEALKQLDGAFSIVVLRGKTLVGARDKNGFRPLVLGKIKKSYIIASESVAIEALGGNYIRDIMPGEVIEIEQGEIKSSFEYTKEVNQRTCIFEQVYFSRADSLAFGKTVKEARVQMGMLLADQMKEICKSADMVIPVPDSGFYAAQGFSRRSKIIFEMGFIRNHYVGRSFIKPLQALRDLTAKLKLSPIKEVVKGKEIILIDDSMVRGTTSKRIIAALKKAGARKIHFALSCPPIIAPCYYGIDTPLKDHLIAANNSIEQMRKYLGVDSLTFLSLQNLIDSCQGNGGKNCFCCACFNGKYPTNISKLSFKTT
ncbi:MAG: amidophosphoribosyltransferase [Elusimicrobiota bacterium]|nr:amidophosphoribosyltransferase [Elusimicrobiota bacterium]